jgi:hypothetical protein
MATTITKDGVAKMLKAVELLTKRQALIGIPASSADRGDGGPINNAMIGWISEMGSPSNNIPPRPHLVPGIEKAMPEAIDRLKKAGQAALGGKLDQVEAGLNEVGLICSASVKTTITNVLEPKLSDATIYRRQHRKVKKAGDPSPHHGTMPLVDSGAYLQAITYVVRDKED